MLKHYASIILRLTVESTVLLILTPGQKEVGASISLHWLYRPSVNEKITWRDANQTCTDRGWRMAVIRDQQDQERLVEAISQAM